MGRLDCRADAPSQPPSGNVALFRPSWSLTSRLMEGRGVRPGVKEDSGGMGGVFGWR
jgi:hypothetical protein